MITAPLGDSQLAASLAALAPDGITRFILADGAVRGALVAGTGLCAQARANHGLGPLETVALSQAYLAAALMAAGLKEGASLSLRVDCSGALGGFLAEGRWDGTVRGYLFNDAVPLAAAPDSFDLEPFIGDGRLTVVRRVKDAEPFTGTVALVHGRIAEDVCEYYLRSEQTRTALVLSVRFDRAGRLAGAGGLLLQALPGAHEIPIGDAEDRLADLPSLGAFFASGRSRADFLSEWFAAFDPVVLEEGPARFGCPCARERFSAYLAALPPVELSGLIAEGPHPAELVCHYCGSRYYFSKDELIALRAVRG
jgi:molecular chaperone Hsp33